MSWVETLKQYNQTHQPPEQEESYQQKEQRVLSELRAIYEERSRKRKEERRAAKQKARAEAAAAAAGSSAVSSQAGGSGSKKRQGASTSEIPRFYIQRTTSPPPADPEPPADGDGAGEGSSGEVPPAPMPSLPALVRREARTRYLEQRADQLLDDRDLAVLWEALKEQSVEARQLAAQAKAEAEAEQAKHNGSSSGSSSKPQSSLPVLPHGIPSLEADMRLSYSSFLSVAHSLPDRCKHASSRFFTASTFLSFPVDVFGCISARALWRYISKKVQLTRLRISLTCYDDVGYGYLREQDLENYVYDQLASLPPLQGLERDFYPYYVFTAVRKFFFFLDPHKRGKLRIKNIVHSPVMLEFDSLRYPAGMGGMNALGERLGGGGAGKKLNTNSWFSAQHTQDVYAIYLGLDTNQNGMLSRREFQAYNGGNLTRIFVEALFAEYRMYPSSATGDEHTDGSWARGEGGQDDTDAGENELEMDYKTFLDFMLAMQYKSSPASIAYFFKVLDIHHQGYLDVFTLTYWFRAVAERMVALGHEAIDVADVVCNEIFDMVNPTATPGRITLQDLISSRCGHTVVSILIDVNGFWRYDNRESLMQSQEEE